MALLALGILMGYRLSSLMQSAKTKSSSMAQATQTKSLSSQELKPQSGALKSMTPLERSLEDSAEIRNKIEELLK